MESNQYKICIANGSKTKGHILSDGSLFNKWIKLDLQIGSVCQYQGNKYVLKGGTARDGTPMSKICTTRGFKRLKIYRKFTKIKIRTRRHSRYISKEINQIFLAPLN